MSFQTTNPDGTITHGELSRLDGCDHAEFPMNEVVARLDGDLEVIETDYAKLARGIGAILDWLFRDLDLKSPDARNTLAHRTIALAFAIRPALVGGDSIRGIAKKIGISPFPVAIESGNFSRHFGIRTRPQRQGCGRYLAAPKTKERKDP